MCMGMMWRRTACAGCEPFLVREEKSLHCLPLKICLAGNDLSVKLSVISYDSGQVMTILEKLVRPFLDS